MEKFSYEANGYNRREVNQFISDVITQTEGIISKCKAQSADIEKMKAELEHYKSLGAIHMPFLHPYQVFWDEEAAIKILKEYNYDRI